MALALKSINSQTTSKLSEQRLTQTPRDAATLILYRRTNHELEVLMGERHGDHAFMPNRYVFPGGRVDPEDWRINPATHLRSDVRAKLERTATPARAHALAMAAVRETFEETGLIIGAPNLDNDQNIPRAWRDFFATGFAPALDQLDYILRAVTPPQRPRRFNARFFITNAATVKGTLKGSGELVNLRWVTLEETRTLKLPNITQLVLGRLEGFLTAPYSTTISAFMQRHGKDIELLE